MHRNHKLSLIGITLVTLSTMTYAAKNHHDNDAIDVIKAKTSLIQAITVAEQSANGKATRAEFEDSAYEVEVVSGAKVFDVKIDADKGTVISSKEDAADDDEHEHHHHDKKD